MRLIGHIIWKDITQHRWALLAWALLFVGQASLGYHLLQVDKLNLEEATQLQQANWVIVFVQFVMGYLLVTQFVQGDELTGTRMFWLTRPISTRRLLAAKALGVLLVFVVLPVLLLLPWWLYCGFGGRDLEWTVLATLGWQLLMIAPAFLVATLTDEIGRALMWTLLLLAGLGAWTVWVQSNLKTMLVGSVPSTNTGLMLSRLWLAAMILVAGSVVASIHQFLTRRLFRSVLLTLPALGLIVLVGRFWSWDCAVLLPNFNQPEPAPLAQDDSYAAVQFTLGPAQILSRNQDSPPSNNRNRFSVPHAWILQSLQVRGLPGNLVINAKAPQQFWRWPDGLTDTSETRFSSWSDQAVRAALGLPERKDDPETTRWLQEHLDKESADRVARGGKPIRARPTLFNTGALLGSTWLPDSLVERMEMQPPASELRVEAEVGRPEIVLHVPLETGAWGGGASHTLRITSIFRPRAFGATATLGVVLTRPGLGASGLWGVLTRHLNLREMPQSVMALDRADGDWWSVSLHYGEGGEPVHAQVGGVDIHWAVCGINSAQVIRDGHWVARYPDWFEHTALVLLGTKPVARFTREVKTDKFELEPDALAKSGPDKPF